MSLVQARKSTILFCATLLLASCVTQSERPEARAEGAPTPTGNPITGEGLPNPTPQVTRNWGTLPEGREWGSTAGIDIDPIDGHIWAYERCGAGTFGAGTPINCDNNPVDPIFKFDRNTGEVLANFGGGTMVTPHGIHVDAGGNVWVTDFAGNEEKTKGHQVHKFSPEGELLMSLGTAGQAGSGPNQFNQPNDVITAPDGSIFVADGHSGQGMTTNQEMEEGRAAGLTARIVKLSADGTYIKEWGQIGVRHGEFRTPHALAFDSQGRLWVADRGNHRIEIFDQDGNYLESRYLYGRISGLFIKDDLVYAIDSESSPTNHPNWRNGVRVGPVDGDHITAFIPPFERENRVYQGTAGEGVAVDADGNVYAAEGPNSLEQAGGAFTKYSVTK
ncbi:MAG TPA: peptidyl-alpha-hydroxyglycine alpha-amidating lyase family protein [Vicinamibacteria bacterium]|nr:peptidyl-alpha-hydroxyglycine alpha-amidating lyase family protein [Vicinamibacteria bacterium]